MSALIIRGIDGGQRSMTNEEITAFRSSFDGQIFLDGEAGYDEARQIWNGMIERRPAIIARCESVEDVQRALSFARDRSLLFSIRGGGHNVAGSALCDGGLTIDLSQMRQVDVNPATNRVVVGPGATWAEVDQVTQPHGLAVPSGIISTTGVAGLTLGGGFGWLTRRWGFTCDRLRAAEVVLADGTRIRASDAEHPDLMWALRGGGGNFGIVTAFEFEAVPVGPTVMAGMILYPLDRIQEVVDFYRRFTEAAPEELATLLVARLAPPAPFLPAEAHGKPVVGFVVCHSGSVEDGAAAIKPIEQLGEPLGSNIKPKPFIEHQTFLDSGQPHGRNYYWKSEYADSVPGEIAGVIATYTNSITSPASAMLMMHLGGAARTAGSEQTAAVYRGGEYIIVPQAAWDGPESAQHIDWIRSYHRDLAAFSSGHNYMNFQTEDERDDRVRSAYKADVYERLREVKGRYDPQNLFRTNKNIAPAAQPAASTVDA